MYTVCKLLDTDNEKMSLSIKQSSDGFKRSYGLKSIKSYNQHRISHFVAFYVCRFLPIRLASSLLGKDDISLSLQRDIVKVATT